MSDPIALSARALEAAGEEVGRVEKGQQAGAWFYIDDTPVPRALKPVPDLTLPENLGRVVEMVRKAGLTPWLMWPVGAMAVATTTKSPLASVGEGPVFGQTPNVAIMTAFIRAKGLEVPE